MKQRYILFRRAGVFYSEDTETRKQHSLRTRDGAEATAIINAKNESVRQPVLNLQIARAYLTASDPGFAGRVWQEVMAQMQTHGKDATKLRCSRAMQSKAFDGTADNIDWNANTLSYFRMKTGEPAQLAIGNALAAILRQLPAAGPLFPGISACLDNARSAEFYRVASCLIFRASRSTATVTHGQNGPRPPGIPNGSRNKPWAIAESGCFCPLAPTGALRLITP